jgi:hypothetical protein
MHSRRHTARQAIQIIRVDGEWVAMNRFNGAEGPRRVDYDTALQDRDVMTEAYRLELIAERKEAL